jgi:hypothetical protein
MQYAGSIDEYARMMEDGNNGGYANNWLIADIQHNEIASLELGLKHITLQRTRDGYFAGSNYPANPELIRDEASDYPVADMSISANARHVRWDQLMQENKGKIDVAAAKHLKQHPQFAWQKSVLRDLDSRPWTVFSRAQ